MIIGANAQVCSFGYISIESYFILIIYIIVMGLECGTLLLVQMFLILFLAYLILRKMMYLILASLCMLYAKFEALF